MPILWMTHLRPKYSVRCELGGTVAVGYRAETTPQGLGCAAGVVSGDLSPTGTHGGCGAPAEVKALRCCDWIR